MKGGPFSGRFGRSRLERDVARFWSYVQRGDGCWLWTGTKSGPNKSGEFYGTFGVSESGRNIQYRAHRLAYMLAVGKVDDGLVVMHTCDTTLCCNPAHLEVGTVQDNIDDRNRKRRHVHGEPTINAILTDELVRRIRRSRFSDSHWSRRLGVHPTCIGNARKGKSWKHVD